MKRALERKEASGPALQRPRACGQGQGTAGPSAHAQRSASSRSGSVCGRSSAGRSELRGERRVRPRAGGSSSGICGRERTRGRTTRAWAAGCARPLLGARKVTKPRGRATPPAEPSNAQPERPVDWTPSLSRPPAGQWHRESSRGRPARWGVNASRGTIATTRSLQGACAHGDVHHGAPSLCYHPDPETTRLQNVQQAHHGLLRDSGKVHASVK